MDIRILAIGRAGKTAEAELFSHYQQSAVKTGKRFGLKNISLQELDERKIDDRQAGSRALLSALNDEPFWLLDERGALLTSPQFAADIASWRDDAKGRLNFVIGGADGVSDELRAQAIKKISFGKMVWPHLLVRVMLAEQIYRATSIWANSPYHRI